MDELEKKEKEDQRVATKQHVENLRNLFEEQKLGLDMTWTQCMTTFADNSIFKAADDLEKLTYLPLYSIILSIKNNILYIYICICVCVICIVYDVSSIV